jgi:bacteriocin-like protein
MSQNTSQNPKSQEQHLVAQVEVQELSDEQLKSVTGGASSNYNSAVHPGS